MQSALFICLLCLLLLQRLVPSERPLLSEFKLYSSVANLTFVRLFLLGMLSLGIGAYLFPLNGLFEAKPWNISFLIGALFILLVAARFIKRVLNCLR